MNISAPFIRRPIATSLLARRASSSPALAAYHAAAGRAAAARRLPDHPGQRDAARREPRDDGLGGGDAARAALRPHRRRHRDHLDERARHDQRSRCSSISIATSTPRRATCRRRSTPPAASCRPTCRRRPNYRKVNPADAPILILSLTLGHAAAGAGVRRGEHRPGAEDRAGRRASVRCSSAAGSSRRCACRSIRRRSPGSGSTLEDVRAAPRAVDGRPAQGRAQRRRAGAARSPPTISCFGADAYRDAHRRATATARRCGSATSRRVIDDVENNRVAAWTERRARGAADHPPPAGRQHHRDHRAREGAAARSSRARSRRRSTSRSRSIARRPSAPRCTTSSARCCSAWCWSCWWCSCSCAALRATRDPERRRAAVAGRHVRRDVPARLQPRQPVADGAHHLDRLRRRRRDRGHREHRALHRAGRAAAARPRSKGAQQIGFTIVSITVSLLAVFIPILLMGGIVGRLFREFAVTLSDRDRRLGGRLADADADDVLAAAAARATEHARRASTRAARARASTRVLRGYERALRCGARATARVDAARRRSRTLGAHGVPLRRWSPRACSRSRTPACSSASPRRRRTSRFAAMQARQEAVNAIVLRRSRRRARRLVHRRRSGAAARQHRHDVHRRCKPRPQRKATRRRDHRAPAPQAGQGPGHRRCSCRRRRTCASAGGSRARSTSTRSRTRTWTSCAQWAPRLLAALQQAARAARTSPPISRPPGLQLDVDDRSRHRRAPRRHAAGRSTTRSTTPSASARWRPSTRQLNQYRVVLEVQPELQHEPEALEHVYVRVADGRARCRCRRSSRIAPGHDAAVDQPPGAVPGDHALVQPRARRRRSARRSTPSTRAELRDRHAGQRPRRLSRARRRPSRPRSTSAADADPGGAARRLHRARHALRELHPPDHDPLDAALGGRRRAARAAAPAAPSSASSRSSASSCSSAS